MKKVILLFLKPLSFLPALCMMYAIYSFSAQTGETSGSLSYTVSYKIVEIGNDLFDVGLQEDRLDYYAKRIDYPVRKLAHMTEYFCLAIAVSFPFYVYGLRGFPLMLVAGLICVGFAAGDEYHQSFVDGRGPSKKDVMIDSVGAFFGILTVRVICWTFLAPFRFIEGIGERARSREMARRQEEELERERIELELERQELARLRAAERRRIEARRHAQERQRDDAFHSEDGPRRTESRRSGSERRRREDGEYASSRSDNERPSRQASSRSDNERSARQASSRSDNERPARQASSRSDYGRPARQASRRRPAQSADEKATQSSSERPVRSAGGRAARPAARRRPAQSQIDTSNTVLH